MDSTTPGPDSSRQIAYRQQPALSMWSIGQGFEGTASDWTEYVVWLTGFFGLIWFLWQKNVMSFPEDHEIEDFQYSISVEKKATGSWGLAARRRGESLIITGIESGPVADWNSTNPDDRVLDGDSIKEVNGVSGTSEILEAEIRAAETKLELVISRPQVLEMLAAEQDAAGDKKDN